MNLQVVIVAPLVAIGGYFQFLITVLTYNMGLFPLRPSCGPMVVARVERRSRYSAERMRGCRELAASWLMAWRSNPLRVVGEGGSS